MPDTVIFHDEKTGRPVLNDPKALPRAGSFLWNPQMLLQANCRGYVTSSFMQPEPAKYAYGPMLEAKTFMQPEQPYYAHHPGRFFYLQPEGGRLVSAPYEPVRAPLDRFEFSPGEGDIRWMIESQGYRLEIRLAVAVDKPLELWQVKVTSIAAGAGKCRLIPCFSVGYMSWMNMSADFDADRRAVIARSVTPYQLTEDYPKQKHFKDMTCLVASRSPDSWCANAEIFEGEGGLHAPDAVTQGSNLPDAVSRFEMPIAAMQFDLDLAPDESEVIDLVFGPAMTEGELDSIFRPVVSSLSEEFEKASSYGASAGGAVIQTPDKELDQFANNWLPRQIFYHGETNRLTTDPQTRNFLQDHLGMLYLDPARARKAILDAVAQQSRSGQMPDGILLGGATELKYINRIPHADPSLWLPLLITAYIGETGDASVLEEQASWKDSKDRSTVREHAEAALNWLFGHRDERGLSLIDQGDWCDPMNMVGTKGIGVSAWLTLALAYTAQDWASLLRTRGLDEGAASWSARASELNEAATTHFWQGRWFGRGITDDNVLFGVAGDPEGSMYLNPQSFAILSGAVSKEGLPKLLDAIDEQLMTPSGPQMLAPAYTAMREDVGRLTQKFPGVSENGAVYNHAVSFYAWALYHAGEGDRAFDILKRMLPGLDTAGRHGQMPVYIPNYYRGAWHQFPEKAGRSSHLLNTGTIAWYYRCLIEGLFGLKGCAEGLMVNPQLPAHWDSASITRDFRGTMFDVSYVRSANTEQLIVLVDGVELPDGIIRDREGKGRVEVQVYV